MWHGRGRGNGEWRDANLADPIPIYPARKSGGVTRAEARFHPFCHPSAVEEAAAAAAASDSCVSPSRLLRQHLRHRGGPEAAAQTASAAFLRTGSGRNVEEKPRIHSTAAN